MRSIILQMGCRSPITHSALRDVTSNLNTLLGRLQSTVPQQATIKSRLSSVEESLQQLSKNCGEVAQELLHRLDKLKIGSRTSRWSSFRMALLSVWSEKDIEELSARLELYRKELDTTILISLR